MEEAEKKQLLEKYMDGLCSQDEIRQVELLRQQPGIEALWDKIIMERSGDAWEANYQPSQRVLDITAKRKAALLAKIAEADSSDRKKNMVPLRKMRFIRYAAVWAGIMLLSSLVYWQIKETFTGNERMVATIEKINPEGVPVCYMLPDSSEVFLGAGSTLKYPENFEGATRVIQLEGEAFFQVTRNPDKPFIIQTGHIETRVLGTSFKVEAFDKQEVVVAVATGKVGVNSVKEGQSQELALLTPGLKVTWDEQMGKAVQGKVDVSGLEGWKTGELIFDEQLMGRVAGELERRYGIRIVFSDQSPSVAQTRVGGTFSAGEPVSGILKMLSVVGEFKYETKDNKLFTLYR